MTDTPKADDKCENCFLDFADHDYVKDSIGTYRCPIPHTDVGYGFFHGGDPRKFFPDDDDCTPSEISNHKLACKLWDECEARGETPKPEKCPSGWLTLEDGRSVHVLRVPYGIGGYVHEYEQFWEPLDPADRCDDDLFI